MGIQVIENVRRTRFAVEPAGAFAVELPIGNFLDAPIIEDGFKMTLTLPLETPQIIQQHLDGYPTPVKLPKSAQLDVTMNLQAPNGRSGPASVVIPSAVAQIIAVVMGGETAEHSNTVNGVATTTVIPMTSVATMVEGGIIVFATGAGGALEAREIADITGTTITLKVALSSAPADTSTGYGGYTSYLGNTDGSTVESLQWAIEGLSEFDRWLLKGGQISSPPTLELKPGGIPRITFSITFADWDYADGINTTMNLVATPIEDQNLSSQGINAVYDSELLAVLEGNTAPNRIDAPDIKITPKIAYVAHKTPAGTNTIKQWVRNRVAPAAECEFAVPLESHDFFDAREENEDDYQIFYQIGSSLVGGGVLISLPAAHIMDWQREGIDNIAAERVKFAARLDRFTTTNSTNLQKSAFRIHFF